MKKSNVNLGCIVFVDVHNVSICSPILNLLFKLLYIIIIHYRIPSNFTVIRLKLCSLPNSTQNKDHYTYLFSSSAKKQFSINHILYLKWINVST